MLLWYVCSPHRLLFYKILVKRFDTKKLNVENSVIIISNKKNMLNYLETVNFYDYDISIHESYLNVRSNMLLIDIVLFFFIHLYLYPTYLHLLFN